jgi:hypothetical protein
VQRVTTTIKREHLQQIISGTKTVEYREDNPYWEAALREVVTPFELRLIAGRVAGSPEATVIVNTVVRRNGTIFLHISKVLSSSPGLPAHNFPKH